MQIQQHHQSSQSLNIQALRHQQYCNNNKLSTYKKKYKLPPSPSKKKKDNSSNWLTVTSARQGFKLPVRELFFLLLYMNPTDISFINASKYISVAES